MYVDDIYIQCKRYYPDSFLIHHTTCWERKTKTRRDERFATFKLLLLSFTAKANYERGEQTRLGAVLQINIKDVCLLSCVHVCEQHREKNTEVGFSANVELFDLLWSLTKNAFDHLTVTAFFKDTWGKTFVTIVGESWRACEYLVTTTGLSMHYQPKDTQQWSQFVFGETALWSAVTEGFTPTSWVSHFSGCHNSSCNIRDLTSAVWNMAARLWSTSTCPLCPVCSCCMKWATDWTEGRKKVEKGGVISLKTMLQEWNLARKKWSLSFCLYVKWKKKKDMMCDDITN